MAKAFLNDMTVTLTVLFLFFLYFSRYKIKAKQKIKAVFLIVNVFYSLFVSSLPIDLAIVFRNIYKKMFSPGRPAKISGVFRKCRMQIYLGMEILKWNIIIFLTLGPFDFQHNAFFCYRYRKTYTRWREVYSSEYFSQ